jgi:hypothetical protein
MPQPGCEVTIDYGGKSNEELLFLYGFALPRNEAEVLTVVCPLPPPGQWDEQLQARLALLERRGLRPQLHLPAAHLALLGERKAAEHAAGHAGAPLHLPLPEGVAETLAVFVLEPSQVQQQLVAGEQAGSAGEIEGLRLAVLTTLVRLLELKALEMEGEAGKPG